MAHRNAVVPPYCNNSCFPSSCCAFTGTAGQVGPHNTIEKPVKTGRFKFRTEHGEMVSSLIIHIKLDLQSTLWLGRLQFSALKVWRSCEMQPELKTKGFFFKKTKQPYWRQNSVTFGLLLDRIVFNIMEERLEVSATRCFTVPITENNTGGECFVIWVKHLHWSRKTNGTAAPVWSSPLEQHPEY